MSARMLSHVWLFAASWAIDHQAPLSMGFVRQEYWGGLPFPHPGDLPDSGIESVSPVASALAGRFFTTEPPEKPQLCNYVTAMQFYFFFFNKGYIDDFYLHFYFNKPFQLIHQTLILILFVKRTSIQFNIH